ncbi:MAG: hypothetical protein M1140_07525 [Chloroflexi bacterium]|nr:hypothetical protein [Chloroflexota bacterium]
MSAKTNDKDTVFAPEFLDMLVEEAEQTLYNWLKRNGPAQIFDLFDAVGGLNSVRAFGVPNNELERQSIQAAVLRTINLVTDLGGEWHNGLTVSQPRTPVV